MKKRNIFIVMCLMIMSAIGGSYAMYYFTGENHKHKDKKENPEYDEDELEMLDLDLYYED